VYILVISDDNASDEREAIEADNNELMQ